jgi:hypothetical protein
VIICDDSSSMQSSLLINMSDPFGPSRTRWEELKATVNIIIQFASILDKQGCDIHFLNRAGAMHVTDSAQVAHCFTAPPSGYTPIVPKLRQVLQQSQIQQHVEGKKLLIIIATDGSPTDSEGRDDTRTLRTVLERERIPKESVYTTFLACTDDSNTMEYLSTWDEEIPHVDVVDDYYSERKEIQQVQGTQFSFTFGDYIVKALLGSIDPELDLLDEVKQGTMKQKIKQSSCNIL